MANGIDRDTFKGYDTDSKLLTLFDYLHDMYNKSCDSDIEIRNNYKIQVETCQKQFAKKKDLDNAVWAIRTIYALPIIALLGWILKGAFGW